MAITQERAGGPGRRRIGLLSLALLWAAACLPAAAQTGVACYAACVPAEHGSAPAACKLVADPAAKPPALEPRSLDDKRYLMIKRCPEYKVELGSVLLRYRHAGQWFNPPELLGQAASLRVVFDKYRADECGVPHPDCVQKRMQTKQAGIGGHGIDGQPSAPGGSGEPCSLGLPCARVLPPPLQWNFQLEDPSLDGQWVVQIARGTPPSSVPRQFTAPVAAGIVSADGALFSPGATYVYRLVDAAGGVRATGEFSLLSRPLVQTLRGLAAKRVEAGQSESTAWVDVLAANEMDWDAYQLSLPGR